MSDRMAGEIWIGGMLPRSVLAECEKYQMGWDGDQFDFSTDDGVQEALDDEGLLHFCDDKAPWGEFQDLETSLRKNSVPFIRKSEGKWEYDPEIVEFRPDLSDLTVLSEERDVCTLTKHDGEPVIIATSVRVVTDKMAELVTTTDTASSRGFRLAMWEKLYNSLLGLLPPVFPSLPPIEIVDG